MDSLLKCFKDKPKNICVMKNRKKTNKVHLLGTYLCILYLFPSPQSTVLTSVTFQSPLLFFYKLVQAKICIKTTFPPHFRYAKCKLENPLIRVLAGLGKFLVQLYTSIPRVSLSNSGMEKVRHFVLVIFFNLHKWFLAKFRNDYNP